MARKSQSVAPKLRHVGRSLSLSEECHKLVIEEQERLEKMLGVPVSYTAVVNKAVKLTFGAAKK